MTAYIYLITTYISNFINQIGYVGDHISSYPGMILVVSLILILGGLGLLNRLINL